MYVLVWVSIHASIHMATRRTPLPKRKYVVLKNARCVCPGVGLYTRFHTYAHCKDNPLQTHTWFSKMPLCVCPCQGLYTCFHNIPTARTPLQTHIRGSHKCPDVYVHVWVSIQASIYMPTARTPLPKCTYVILKNSRCVCPCLGLYTRFDTYAHCKDTPLQTHTWFSKMPLCVCPHQGLYTRFRIYAHCKDTPPQTHIRGSQKCPSVYAHVRVSTHASAHMPIARTPLSKRTYVILKNAPQCMPPSWFLHTLPYICPLKGHLSPNAHACFSKMPLCVCQFQGLYTRFSTYAHCKDTPPKNTYVVLKNARCMPMSGSLHTLPYICPLQGQPSPNAHTWFSKMPRCVCPRKGLYIRFRTYAHCKDTPLQKHIRGSQKCPAVYAHVRVSTHASVHMPTAGTPLSKRTCGSQKCPSVYAHIRVSTHASVYMPIARTPLPKRT